MKNRASGVYISSQTCYHHPMYRELAGQCVWITGASSGIGLELALLAAASGAHLFLFSSNQEKLAKATQLCRDKNAASVHYDVLDLGNSKATLAVVSPLLSSGNIPKVLLLNAGLSQRALAGETSLAVTERLMSVNFFGSVTVARTVLPKMLENGGGRIGVTSSLTGVFGFPLRSSYAASKHALNGYFESLRLEYARQGITVTIALPGRICTDIGLRSLKADGQFYNKQDPGQKKGMDARLCAKKYWKALLHHRREVLIGGMDTVMVFLRRILPGVFYKIAQRINPL